MELVLDNFALIKNQCNW